MFGGNIATLAAGRRVVAVDLQAHGHTSDVDRPLRFESMADDVTALLKQIGAAPADIVGYSLGGGVALQMAIRQPQAVRKLVVVSAPLARRGWFPGIRDQFDQMSASAAQYAAATKQGPLSKLYPDKDWRNVFAKLGDLLSRDYDWTAGVKTIKAPVMLVYADADAIDPAHIAEFYKLVGGGQRDAGQDGSARSIAQLAVLPGTTHYDVFKEDRAPVIGPFLDAPMPAKK
jgi:pimeloyl-ACP methyl ester carboxylesterase